MYGCVILSALAIAAGSYFYIVVNELKGRLAASEIRSKTYAGRMSSLETGSFTKSSSLKAFLNFASKDDVKYENLILDKAILEKGQKALVLENVELAPLIENQCQRYRCYQHKIPFSEVPSSLWKGLLGIEDYRFLQHKGVDLISIGRALITDIKAMSLVQGGSTLTQQLAKNLFLSNEKKLERKLREVVYALYLEQSYSKEEIVTMYFNEVFWGTLGGVYLKGVEVASRAYFDKKPGDLDDFESALLIGMLKGPYFYHPIKHLDRLKKRTLVVYNRLRELRLVSSDETLAWSDQEWSRWQKNLIQKNNSSHLRNLYLVSRNEERGLEPYEKLIFYQAVEKTRTALAERTEGVDIAVKAAVVDASCQSLGSVNGLDCPAAFTYYSKFERDRLKAIYEERHQVGSILKPIIYQQLLNEGKSLDDMVSTKPVTLKLNSGEWTPSDASYNGVEEVSLKFAIQKSRNIPLIRASQEVGFDPLEKRLLDYFPRLLSPLGEYPAQLLGAIELSMEELSRAYLKFFTRQCDAFKSGEAKYEESLLYYLAQAKDTTIARVAGDVIKQSLIFGKTGTTNNGLDNWYIAFDGQNFYSIWFGVDSAREGKKLHLYGSNSSFKIFQDFIQYRGKQVSDFRCR